MQFLVPHQSIMFEIPDTWLEEGNAVGFWPSRQAYVAVADPEWPTVMVPLSEVAAPARNAGIVGLHQARTVSLLRAIASGRAVPSIPADEPPDYQAPLRYRVRDGYHRFYISVALGFSHVPLAVRPYFELGAP